MQFSWPSAVSTRRYYSAVSFPSFIHTYIISHIGINDLSLIKSISLGQFRCNLASRRHANDSTVRVAGPAADNGDDLASLHAHPRLEHNRAGRLQRLHLDDPLDRRLPHDKHARAQVQAWIRHVNDGAPARLRREQAIFSPPASDAQKEREKATKRSERAAAPPPPPLSHITHHVYSVTINYLSSSPSLIYNPYFPCVCVEKGKDSSRRRRKERTPR